MWEFTIKISRRVWADVSSCIGSPQHAPGSILTFDVNVGKGVLIENIWVESMLLFRHSANSSVPYYFTLIGDKAPPAAHDSSEDVRAHS